MKRFVSRFSGGGCPQAGSGGLASIFTLALLGLSCGQGFRPGELRLEMPPCPDSWNGLVRERRISLSVYRIDRDGRSLLARDVPFGGSLAVPRPDSDFAVFLAEPEGRKACLKPAGALYPLQAAGGTLLLDFPGGWTACAAIRLLSLDPALAKTFNWARLEIEAAERLEDPWLCQPETLAEAAASGSFGVYRLKSRECFVVSMNLPERPEGEGEERLWLPDSPYSRPVAESSGVFSPCLPEGVSIMYRENERLSVQIDARGGAQAFLLPD